MPQGMRGRALNPELLDKWFDSTVKEQYTRDLLFSKKVSIVSKRTVKSPRGRFRENRWWSTTPSYVYRSMRSPERMVTIKSGPFLNQ
jgi:hypothetical protein